MKAWAGAIESARDEVARIMEAARAKQKAIGRQAPEWDGAPGSYRGWLAAIIAYCDSEGLPGAAEVYRREQQIFLLGSDPCRSQEFGRCLTERAWERCFCPYDNEAMRKLEGKRPAEFWIDEDGVGRYER